jgi:hypothetical protein
MLQREFNNELPPFYSAINNSSGEIFYNNLLTNIDSKIKPNSDRGGFI